MTNTRNPILRSIALTLVVAFALQEAAHAAPVNSLSASALAQPQNVIVQDPSRFEVPSEFAYLREVHKGSDGTLIIHIQDAHTNLSGQENLAKALDEIMSKYKVSLVLVEGGSKDDTLTAIKEVAPAEVWKRVAKNFLVEGKISGEEYLNLISDHPMRILGIEDRALYLQSVRAYADLAARRPAILEVLRKTRIGLGKAKQKSYPADLLAYENDRNGSGPKDKDFEDKFKKLIYLCDVNAGLKSSAKQFSQIQRLRVV
ncbi:MAG TPA: hypothetical protein VD883_04105, partial [Candidatus Omnitrophota bacterium]|nr:hypothetical protein [Candidatus Omnitrophota bacterium]